MSAGPRGFKWRNVGDAIQDGDFGRMSNGNLLPITRDQFGMRVEKKNDIAYKVDAVKPSAGHTPGPWHVIPSHSFDQRTIGRSPAYDPLPIAIVGPVSKYSSPETDAEQTANARLIAAAPTHHEELLAVVELLAAYVSGEPVEMCAFAERLESVRAAILKAEAGK